MDYYLEDPARLAGQPKRTIADYVEQNGILVPRRFDSLAAARSSHRPIFLRSEHPQEYDGVSGLLDSFELSNKFYPVKSSRNVEEAVERYFNYLDHKKDKPFYQIYCRLLNLNEDEFKSQVTFSIWEYLPGYNRTVVADSAIPGRHHVITRWKEDNEFCRVYHIFKDGKLENICVGSRAEELDAGQENLIETYEQVRHLPHFDSNHCPIMEFQTYQDKNYFLQYHRGRDFSPATFTLDRSLRKGEKEALFVRGATSSAEGQIFKITVYYGVYDTFLPENEDGSFDLHRRSIFSALQYRRRKLQISSATDCIYEFDSLGGAHGSVSKMFKPEIFTIFPIAEVLRDHEVCWGIPWYVEISEKHRYNPRYPTLKPGQQIFDFSEEAKQKVRTKTGQNSYLTIHFISDGNRAIVERV